MKSGVEIPRYVRFVADEGETDDGYDQTGVFTIAQGCSDDGRFNQYERDRLEQIFDWFNEHLPCPPFEANLKSRAWSRDCVAWFHESASHMIANMWELVWMLQEAGVPARMITTTKPGKVLYEDEYQIVAETPRCRAERL